MILGKRGCITAADAVALLNCRRLPGRLSTTETAIVLGFQEHDIAPLIAARMLTPLGKPAPNAPKYFAALEIQACAENREWLSQATRALARHWATKNQTRTAESSSPQPSNS